MPAPRARETRRLSGRRRGANADPAASARRNKAELAEYGDAVVEAFVNRGRAEGGELGITDGAIGALMQVLSSRQLRPTKKQLGQLAQCTDLAKLDRWFERSLTAETAAEVFKD